MKGPNAADQFYVENAGRVRIEERVPGNSKTSEKKLKTREGWSRDFEYWDARVRLERNLETKYCW